MSTTILDTLAGILEGGVEADDVLREAVSKLVAEPAIEWVGIAFLDEGTLVLGPAEGEPDESQRVTVPILFQDTVVGELWVDGDPDPEVLSSVAALLAGHVLIGWDTRGEAWDP